MWQRWPTVQDTHRELRLGGGGWELSYTCCWCICIYDVTTFVYDIYIHMHQHHIFLHHIYIIFFLSACQSEKMQFRHIAHDQEIL